MCGAAKPAIDEIADPRMRLPDAVTLRDPTTGSAASQQKELLRMLSEIEVDVIVPSWPMRWITIRSDSVARGRAAVLARKRASGASGRLTASL
jgi:hypothetical protein